ncbi:MAG: type I DNA topoisomerase [Bacteroidaceae bacterium]|nr:type I DNA topoisomerase [Bacteroidaceae bacterium]
MQNLVIVESPAKAKTIERFLGKDYKVMPSYGHIRDLKKKTFSIDTDTFSPVYEIPDDKKEVVNKLMSQAEKADMVWLASDEDREGEAISWHLTEVLKLKPENTKRIVFHEITKNAILQAIEEPRNIDINLVNAQQARRVLDRIVGFELSPVLWKKVKPALSAGRVQSVTVKLIVEREREIQAFQPKAAFRVTADFTWEGKDGKACELKAELTKRFNTEKETIDFLESCKNAQFTISEVEKHPVKKYPAPPFTTSTLQQEASRKLGLSVAQTMRLAQSLYESGKITYMRTDSVNLSSLAINTSRKAIAELMGEKYVHNRQFTTKVKGAQEAHEAIRPTYIEQTTIEGTGAEKRLYDLIWKRTIASQMAEAELEKTTVTISMDNNAEQFIATGEVVKFDGFLKVYRESTDDEVVEDEIRQLPPVVKGQAVNRKSICATERFSQQPTRYTEAGLVHKLEELGIGRPSTYAPTISTIQQREYVVKGDKPGVKRNYQVITLTGNKISSKTASEMAGVEKGKLLPTDIGTVVNDFLDENFPKIMDYNFTANVEKEFDDIAEGKEEWTDAMQSFYKEFHPMVEKATSKKGEHKVGERVLGKDPKTGKPVSVKIGRFGPMAQIGSADDSVKPRFAQLKKNMSIETVSLEEVLDLFKLPRTLGEHEGKDVTVGTGKFGPYIHYGKTYVSVPKTIDPLEITLEEAIDLLKDKEDSNAKKHLKKFEEEPELEIMNGRYGPYIAYNGVNYKIPKSVKDPTTLTLAACKEIVAKEEQRKGTKETANAEGEATPKATRKRK